MDKSADKLRGLINELEQDFDAINANRVDLLLQIAKNLELIYNSEGKLDIIVICTHNSRRSQVAQIWLELAFAQYNFKNSRAYSGGTEETALNYRMAKAINDYGVTLIKIDEGENPIYSISPSILSSQSKYFSKKITSDHNPQSGFVALIVCSNADKNCPIVYGAKERIYLPYFDPKDFDNSPEEEKAYTDKVAEIGREMIYILKHINKNID